jgi:chitodextrinase
MTRIAKKDDLEQLAGATIDVEDVDGEVAITEADTHTVKRATGPTSVLLPAGVGRGVHVEIVRDTTGDVSISAGVGVTLVATSGPIVAVIGEHDSARVLSLGGDRWLVSGSIVEADETADTEAPSVPAGLTVTADTESSIALTWTASSDNVAVVGYRVRRDGVLVAHSTGITYTDLGLPPDTEFTYTVAAFDAAGNESAESAPVTHSTAPTVYDTPDVGVASTNSTSTTGVHVGGMTIDHPGGMVDGDMVLIPAVLSRQGGGVVTWVPPDGFALLTAQDLSGVTHLALFAKRIEDAGTEPTWTINATPTGTPTVLNFAAGAVRLAGVDDVDSWELEIVLDGVSVNTHFAPPVDVAVEGSLVLIGAVGARDGTWTPPTGYTEIFDVANGGNASSDRGSIMLSRRDELADVGTETPDAFNYSLARGSINFSIAVTPSTPDVPSGPSGELLLYAPPTLTSPTTVHLSNSNRSVVLDPNTDYIVVIDEPIDTPGGIGINGGRNVELIGGAVGFTQDYCLIDATYTWAGGLVTVTCATAHGAATGARRYFRGVTGDLAAVDGDQTVTVVSSTVFTFPLAGSGTSGTCVARDNSLLGQRQRAINLTGNPAQTESRIVHIEGLHLFGDFMWEGVNIDCRSEPGMSVQIQNMLVDKIHTHLHSNGHAGGDVIQAWNGPEILRVHRLSALSCGYQGFFMQPKEYGSGPVDTFHFDQVSLDGSTYVSPSGNKKGENSSAYLLWKANAGTGWSIIANEVYAKRNPGKSFPQGVVWGEGGAGDNSEWQAVDALPPGGHFVSIADCGMGYVSPGYD